MCRAASIRAPISQVRKEKATTENIHFPRVGSEARLPCFLILCMSFLRMVMSIPVGTIILMARPMVKPSRRSMDSASWANAHGTDIRESSLSLTMNTRVIWPASISIWPLATKTWSWIGLVICWAVRIRASLLPTGLSTC